MAESPPLRRMRVVTVNRPDRKLTKKKKYSEITPPKLGCQFEIRNFGFRIGSSYSGPVPSIASSVKPKAEIPDTWLALVISHVSQLQSPKMWVWVKLTRNNQDSMVGIGIFKMLSKWCLANGKYMKMWICHSDFPYQLSCPSQDPRPMERKSIIRAIPCEVRETPRFCSRRLEVMFRCLLAGIWRSLWHMKSPNVVEKNIHFWHFEGEP